MITERINHYFNIFFIFFVFYILTSTVLNDFFPVKFLGFSLFITVIPICLIALIFILALPFFTSEDYFFLLVLVFCVSIVFLLQSFFGINDRNGILSYLVFHRYIFSCVILFCVLRKMNFRKYYIHYGVVFFIVFVFSNITSILYLLELPTYRIISTKGEDIVYLRFGGIWGAANGFSNMMIIILAYFVFAFNNNNLFKYSMFLLGFFGWIASGSRSVILYFLLILPFVIYSLYKLESSAKKYIFSMFVMGVFGIAILVFSGLWDTLSELGGAIQRMEEMGGEDIRSEKNTIYLKILFSDFQSFLLGLSTKVQEGQHGVIDFSDNAILLLIIDNGFPLACIFLFILGYLYFTVPNNKQLETASALRRKYPYSLSLIILFMIFALTSGMNNTIIWDFYLYTTIIVFFILRDPMVRLKNAPF